MSDDSVVQAAINARTFLSPGTYTLTGPVSIGQYGRLAGSGGDTYLLPETPGYPLVIFSGPSATVKDIHLGRYDWPVEASHAILASGGLDRLLIDNVWADGRYSTAVFQSLNCHSSSIRHSTFWNYMPERFTAIWDGSSDWSSFQCEYHQQSTQTTSHVIWMTNGCSTLRHFGGNVSYKTGNGSPGWFNDAVNARQLYGTTLYQEP